MKNILFIFLILLLFTSCRHDVPVPLSDDEISASAYPEEVGKIILTRCAIPGCHTNESKAAAGNLSLISWDKLFEGNKNGAVVVPFRPDHSTMMFFVNTYPDLGISLQPRMPLTGDVLTRNEVTILKEWIMNGAPDKNGFIKFSDDPQRKKIYVTNQGCDVVAVYDAETKLIMRYINTGVTNGIESPHMLKVSPDGQYWYVVFSAGNYVQKYRTSDDTFAGQVYVGDGSWNTIVISSDSKKAFSVDWSANGKIAYIDLENMSLINTYKWSGILKWPHGITANKNFTTLYVTAQTGNYIYKIDINDPANPEIDEIKLQPGQPISNVSSLDPHEIVMSPDGNKYFVACQKSNELRVMNTANDSLLAIIPVGSFPQEPVISEKNGYLFLTCMEDTVSFPGKRGSVAVINYHNHTLIKKIFTGFQPHGLITDDEAGLVYVANRNIDTGGPAPHHTSTCGGRNGYLTIINMNTLELLPFRSEISADPFSVDLKK